MARKPKQQDLFRADTRFFIMLSSLLTDENENGETRLAEMGLAGLAVLVCLRCSADFDSGLVSIGQREIARQTGIRQQTAGKYLSKLISLGYVKKINEDETQKRGLYQLTDHISLEHRDEPAGKMLVPYKPKQIGSMLTDVKHFLHNGYLPESAREAGVKVSITVNITNIQNAENVFLGTEQDVNEHYNSILSMPNGPIKKLALQALREQLDRLEQE